MERQPIPPEIAQEILRRLHVAETEHDVRILYACESGSRAWGFASEDSDFDVRFIYARQPDWYLSFDVERRRDVIEYPIVDEIDCGGWDLRKALHLFTRTNGALLEWLNSPIVYIEKGSFARRLRELAPQTFNDIALCYHYCHMARANAREYLLRDQARLKKYFYVLRPLFAIRYIEGGGGVPPMEFEKLLDTVAPDELRPSILELLRLKRSLPELGVGKPIPEINNFIAQELDRHTGRFSGHGRPDIEDSRRTREQLNLLFRDSLEEPPSEQTSPAHH